jgi:hypothetical protein
MTAQPSTSLRVRFAKAIGWKLDDSSAHEHCGIKWIPPSGSYLYPWHKTEEAAWRYATTVMVPLLPNPTDSNAVREAMMGMTEEEWKAFTALLAFRLDIKNGTWDATPIMEKVLKTPPTTLAELVCEVRNV